VRAYGNNYKYVGSYVQTIINEWFTGSSTAQILPANANLRNYTVKNNITQTIGTCCDLAKSKTDGLSKPIAEPDRTGLNVAFALSFSEAYNYVSNTGFFRNITPAMQESPAVAKANYALLKKYTASDRVYAIWLRSLGDGIWLLPFTSTCAPFANV